MCVCVCVFAFELYIFLCVINIRANLHLSTNCLCATNQFIEKIPNPLTPCNLSDNYRKLNRGLYRSEHFINCLCLSQFYPLCIHCKGKRFQSTNNTKYMKSPIRASISVDHIDRDESSNFLRIPQRQSDPNRLNVTSPFKPTSSYDERKNLRDKLLPLNFLKTSIPIRSLDSSCATSVGHSMHSFAEQIRPIRREKSAFLKSSSFNSFECDTYLIVDRPRSAMEMYAVDSSFNTKFKSNSSPETKSATDDTDHSVDVHKRNKNSMKIQRKIDFNADLGNNVGIEVIVTNAKSNENEQKPQKRNSVEMNMSSSSMATALTKPMTSIHQMKNESKSSCNVVVAVDDKNDSNELKKLASNRRKNIVGNEQNSNIDDATTCDDAADENSSSPCVETMQTEIGMASGAVTGCVGNKMTTPTTTKSPKKSSTRMRKNRKIKTTKNASNVVGTKPTNQMIFNKVNSLPSDESFTDERTNESGSDDVFEPPPIVSKSTTSIDNLMQRRRSSSLEDLKMFQLKKKLQSENSLHDQTIHEESQRPNRNRSRSSVSINEKPQYFEYNHKHLSENQSIIQHNSRHSLPSIANCKSDDQSLFMQMSPKRGLLKNHSPKPNPVTIDAVKKTNENDDDAIDNSRKHKNSTEYDIRDRIRGHGSDNGNQRFYRDNSEQDSLRGHSHRGNRSKDNEDSFNRSTSTAEGTSEDKVGKENRNQYIFSQCSNRLTFQKWMYSLFLVNQMEA